MNSQSTLLHILQGIEPPYEDRVEILEAQGREYPETQEVKGQHLIVPLTDATSVMFLQLLNEAEKHYQADRWQTHIIVYELKEKAHVGYWRSRPRENG